MAPHVEDQFQHDHAQNHRCGFAQQQAQAAAEYQHHVHENNAAVGLGHLGLDRSRKILLPAQEVAEKVQSGNAWRGIMIDGAGIGSCMAANKVAGVRAAMCYDFATAFNSREHNNANVLTLGAGLIGPNLAKQIITTFLETEFGGGRHANRVDKIMEIEK